MIQNDFKCVIESSFTELLLSSDWNTPINSYNLKSYCKKGERFHLETNLNDNILLIEIELDFKRIQQSVKVLDLITDFTSETFNTAFKDLRKLKLKVELLVTNLFTSETIVKQIKKENEAVNFELEATKKDSTDSIEKNSKMNRIISFKNDPSNFNQQNENEFSK